MVIGRVAVVAQTPDVGVKVQVVVPRMVVSIDAFQVPFIVGELVEVVGKIGAIEFRQRDAIDANFVMTLGVTVTFSV